jgi:glycosyltransferase involved in cell wall biosynthesis
MKPLRFCMLTTFYPPEGFGGDAIQVQRLARALADRGHEVTVLHSPQAYRALAWRRGPDHRLPGTTGREEHPRIRVVPVDSRAGALSPAATYLTGRPLLTRSNLERELGRGFDVVHFHNPSLLGGAGTLEQGEGIKLYTAHEQWLVCPTHALWKYQRRVCEKPQCWRCGLTYARPPQLWRSTDLLRRSVAQLDALIAPSRTVAQLHERFASVVRIERLAHFVPAPLGGDAGASGRGLGGSQGSGSERRYFLFAGRLERLKGVESLLEPFRRRPSEDLLIAGVGTREQALRRAAADMPNVRFLGWVGTDDLDALYRGARAVLVPTLGHESFGLVAVEALARGTPAIVRGFGALAELAEESGAALTFDTEEQLEAALARLAGDDDLRRELSERGRASYLERWTTEVHLGGYFQLIATLARERGDSELGEIAAAQVDSPGAEAPA